MAFTDWATGDLAIRDLTTQKVKRLLVKPGTWGDSKDSGTYGEWPVLSPDLRQIVYLWAIDEREHRFQLRVMANEPGAKSRLVIDSPENIDYKPVSWFPDRASVLVAIQKPGRDWQLARVSVSDGAVTVLKSLEWRIDSWDRCDVSPDGQNIVYSALAVNPSKPVPAPHEPKDRHIYILAADGSSETEIVKTSGINQNPVWTPDGKRILFTSDRSGKFDLWSQAIQDGKAAGAASMVRADIGDISTMGIYGGSYYVFDRLPQGSEYIHIVEPASGGNARETDTFVGLAPKWSPDGKSIAFKRHHPGSGDSYDLVVHLIETGDERTYNPNLGTTGNGPPLWFHDRSLVTGFTVAGSAAAYQIRLEPKDFKELPLHIQLWSAAISPDDKTAYFVRRANDGKPAQVIAVNLGTGEERSIFVSQGNRPLSIALSPDGRTIALRQYGQIARMSVDGTGFREVYTMPANGAGNGRVAWSSDGSSILFDQRQPGGASHRALMRIQADGGGVPSLAFSARSMTGFDPSPDGSHFAFSSSDKTIDLWALDNVLAGFK
jgi:Tol biopolymer transport system component